MHMYQKHILDLLRKSESLRYSELQPSGVESSHFKYHLNQLISEKLVSHKTRGVYALSDTGKKFVDRLSEDSVITQASPKIITYTLIEDTENYYLQKKPKAPYRNLLNMVGGKVHVGETTQEAAHRELEEKVGECSESPALQSVGEVRTYRNEELYTHVVVYIYKVSVTAFQALDSLVKIPKKNITLQNELAPDFLHILNNIEVEKPRPLFSVDCTYSSAPA